MSALPLRPYAVLLPVALLFAVLSHYFYWQIGDDSYIYFRYVERALAGQWWSWSDHSAPVEGYSSPLWYLLLIAAGKAGLAVETAARALGLLFAAVTVAGGWQLGRQLGLNHGQAALACLLLVLNHGFHYWSTAGLETALYMALFVWSVCGIVAGRHWLLPTALIGIARPEGPFLLLAIVVALVVFRRQLLSPVSLALLLAPTLLWLLLRLAVYGVPLPNTFYAKATGGDTFSQLALGTLYCLPVLLPLLAIWLLWLARKLEAQRDAVMVAAGMVTMLLGIVWLGGGDWMFHFRLLTPMLAPLLALWLYAMVQTGTAARLLLCTSLLPLVLLVVPPPQLLAAFTGKQLPVQLYQEGEFTAASIRLAARLREDYPDGVLIAVNHAGALPWALPAFDVIDMVGLNDAHIARVEGNMHKKNDPDYVLSLQPQLLILNSRVRPGTDGIWYHPGYWSGETALVEHPGFADYQPTGQLMAWDWQIPFPYSLFARQKNLTSWIIVYRYQPSAP